MDKTLPFQKLQHEFAAHIRDPESQPAPAGIEDRRMKIYRDLFFNNLVKLLAGTFPVLSKILGDERWRVLVRQYFSTHRSQTPYFLEVPKDFLGYLQNEHKATGDDLPFMNELAHYEWVELALQIDTREFDLSDIDPDGDLSAGRPVLSPLAWVLAYAYPVHRISPTNQPQSPAEQGTFLVVYRDRDDKVGFMEINAVTARLLELLQDDTNTGTGGELLAQIAGEIKHPDPQVVSDGGENILADLHHKDIILGTKI
ncbi:MAG: putative DNA-binding domain-containing protein [Gammaproteobacteria bacterium]|nr:putative DNA-binding domain-containing protein [Gammaproteobacteria bacterium]